MNTCCIVRGAVTPLKEEKEGPLTFLVYSLNPPCAGGKVRGWGGRLGSLMPGKMREESLWRRVGPGGSESSGGSLP